jgi:hypothetical protein
MTRFQLLCVVALLSVLASVGCDSRGTDTGNAACAFPACSFRARASTPDGTQWRGLLSLVNPPYGINLTASPVYEGDGLCINGTGSLVVWFELSGTAEVSKDASGNVRAMWAAGGPADEFAPKVRSGGGDPAVLAMELTLSGDGHLKATVTVDTWPPESPTWATTNVVDASRDAAAGAATTITVEGPFDFSACDGNTASLPLSDGTSMIFPCVATWSDPTVYVAPAPTGRCEVVW